MNLPYWGKFVGGIGEFGAGTSLQILTSQGSVVLSFLLRCPVYDLFTYLLLKKSLLVFKNKIYLRIFTISSKSNGVWDNSDKIRPAAWPACTYHVSGLLSHNLNTSWSSRVWIYSNCYLLENLALQFAPKLSFIFVP